MIAVITILAISSAWTVVSTWLDDTFEWDHFNVTATQFRHLEGKEFTASWWPAFCEAKRW